MQPCFTQRIQQRELCYGHERESITRLACKKLVRAVPFDVLLGDNIDNGYCFMYIYSNKSSYFMLQPCILGIHGIWHTPHFVQVCG